MWIVFLLYVTTTVTGKPVLFEHYEMHSAFDYRLVILLKVFVFLFIYFFMLINESIVFNTATTVKSNEKKFTNQIESVLTFSLCSNSRLNIFFAMLFWMLSRFFVVVFHCFSLSCWVNLKSMIFSLATIFSSINERARERTYMFFSHHVTQNA